MCLYCKNEELNEHLKETKEMFKGKQNWSYTKCLEGHGSPKR